MPVRIACKCCNQSSESHLMVTCSVCREKFKHTCVDITSNEVRTLNSNTGYDWTCVNCRAFGRDLKDLKALIIKLQNDISELKAEKARSTPGVDFEEIIAEISERQKRKNNIMLFNVPEPDQSSALAVQVASDKNKVVEILDVVIPGSSFAAIKPTRIGTFTVSENRPIKISLESIDTAKNVLRNARKLKSNNNFKNIIISADRTKRQMEHYKSVKQKLDNRHNSGDINCRIKYFNDVPKIVPLN
nr:unnamed protein product [Callosobruchus chinensis]CAH7724235.1 unnamed protein product [Callosobruchus chinensis]CAH7730910.1 unnamed protein product [Callosobruchus chinensis]